MGCGVCPICGKEFVIKSKNQKYCSDPCRWRKEAIRRKELRAIDRQYLPAVQQSRARQKITYTDKFEEMREQLIRLNRIKAKLNIDTAIKFKLPIQTQGGGEMNGKTIVGVIKQITDSIITVKNEVRTYSIMWNDIYTKRVKIGLKNENMGVTA